MSQLVSKPDHSNPLGNIANKLVLIDPRLQIFFDDIQQRLNDFVLGTGVRLPVYTVLTLPTVPIAAEPTLIYVSDESTGATVANSNGTNWVIIGTTTVIT